LVVILVSVLNFRQFVSIVLVKKHSKSKILYGLQA